MRRLALLGATCIALATAAAACGDTPLQPRDLAGSRLAPSFATSSTSLVCENAIYPTSLCWPYDLQGVYGRRALLCSALRTGSPIFYDPVVGSKATEVFTPITSGTAAGGANEVVTIPRPYPYPPRVLTFYVSKAQLNEICKDYPA